MEGTSGVVARRIICTGESTRRREAHLRQGRVSEGSVPSLNASSTGNVRRAIDIHEGKKLKVRLQALVRQAVPSTVRQVELREGEP